MILPNLRELVKRAEVAEEFRWSARMVPEEEQDDEMGDEKLADAYGFEREYERRIGVRQR
jgi:hypothetical protein